MMIDIASVLSYVEFDEVKDYKTTHEIQTKLKDIYGEDENVRKAKEKSLRGQFDQIKMREDENITKYVKRIKASVSTIKASRGDIDDTTIISKVLRTLLPIYKIRVSAIQEMRCDPNKKLTLDALVGRVIAFELDNYDNYVPVSKNIESAFEEKLTLKEKRKKSKANKSRSEEETEESFDSDLEIVEALLAKKYSKDKGKYKGKISLIYFSCEEVGHIAARCPNQ